MKNQYTSGISVSYIDRVAVIEQTKETYERTESGKSWKHKPSEVEKKVIPAQFYYNVVDAIPFFRNLGGTERVTRGYTLCGYIPISVTSVSPDRSEKIVYSFRFTEKTR